MNNFDENTYRIFRLSLAFEDYLDNTGNDIPEIDEAYDSLNFFKKIREILLKRKN